MPQQEGNIIYSWSLLSDKIGIRKAAETYIVTIRADGQGIIHDTSVTLEVLSASPAWER